MDYVEGYRGIKKMDWSFLKQKKSIISIIICLISLYFCVINNLYFEKNYINSIYNESSGQVSRDVVSGDVLEQEFVLNEGDEGVAVLFATYGTTISQGVIEVEVYDDQGAVVFEDDMSATLIKDNQYYNIMFQDVADDLYDQTCKLRMTFVGIENQTIGVYATTEEVMDCAYYINEVEQTNDLALNGVERAADSLRWKDIRLFYLFALILVLIYVFAFKIDVKQINVKAEINKFVLWLRNNKKYIIFSFLAIVVAAILASIAESMYMKEKGYVNPYRWLMIFVVNGVVMVSFLLRKHIWKHAHIYFFVVSMLIGIVAIVSVPFAHISWDEHIHYGDTAYMSWGANGVISVADYNITIGNGCGVYEKDYRVECISYLNSFSQTEFVEYEDSVGLRMFSYIPASIGLFLARLFGLSFFEEYMMGKLANIFCYSLFLSMAIKNLQQRGKIIVAVLGLVPTSIFLAACYSYDWWVIAFIIWGFSIFIGEIQRNGYIKTPKLIQSVVVLVIGILIKAVYFPIMFPMMLLKKEKYSDSKKARAIVFLGMVFLLASFILPMFFSGAGTNDYRGGDGINSSEQIKFILTNVFGYAEILFNYLWYYLSPDNAHHYLTFLAYAGGIGYASLILILLMIATVIDNSDNLVFREKNPMVRIGTALGALGSIVLVATALYVSFTPVGLDTINGCQFRYILPVLFPFLFFMGEHEIKVSTELKQKVYIVSIIIMMLIFMNGWSQVIIGKY